MQVSPRKYVEEREQKTREQGAGLRSGRSGGSRAFKVNSLSGGAHAEEDPMGEGEVEIIDPILRRARSRLRN